MSQYYEELSVTFTEPEDRQFTVFAKGIYRFRILEVNAVKLSQNTRVPMIPIKFEFTRTDGETTTVYENLLFQENMKWKIDQFLKCLYGEKIASGKKFDWNETDVIDHIKRQTGTARLKVEKVKDKDYDRNTIDAFVYAKEDTKTATRPPEPEPSFGDDDEIPF